MRGFAVPSWFVWWCGCAGFGHFIWFVWSISWLVGAGAREPAGSRLRYSVGVVVLPDTMAMINFTHDMPCTFFSQKVFL